MPEPEVLAPKPRKPPTALKEYHDESWNTAFEEEKLPDFTGLKIATMIKPPTPPPESVIPLTIPRRSIYLYLYLWIWLGVGILGWLWCVFQYSVG